MIIFLTLCYCGLLALLVYLKVIKLSLWWKLSPLAWIILLLVVLFIPMQWGAPAGSVNSYQYVVEIIPNVSGEVIEVPVQGLEPLQAGDVLFRIDPVPYQAKVDQFRSQLAEAKQRVGQLESAAVAAHASVKKTEADIELGKADERSAAANLNAVNAGLAELKGKKNKAIAVRDDFRVQVTAGKREYERVEQLVARKAAAESDLDIAQVKLASLQSQLSAADADVLVADDSIARGAAEVVAAEVGLESTALRVKQLVETELPRVNAKAQEADLAATSMIGDKHTLVATAEAQLVQANFDLEQTVVRAPSDGFVIGMTLRPGQRVANFPIRGWMSFVSTEASILGVGIPQYTLRHVKQGQKAEVTLKLFPGQVFPATVQGVGLITSEGQLQPSGLVMQSPGVSQTGVPYGVRLKIDEDAGIDEFQIPGGAVGTAAIYTEKMKTTHLIRRVMVRMEAWLNYIKPW